MKKIRSLLHHSVLWSFAAALLAIIAVPAFFVAVVLKLLALAHGLSAHSWLLDVGQNVPLGGAAGGGPAGGAGSGDPNPSPDDKDPDPCAGEKSALIRDQGFVDTYKSQLDYYAQQIDALAAPAQQLLNQASGLASAAQWEVEKQFLLTAGTTVIQLLMAVVTDGQAAQGLLGGEDTAKSVEEVSKTLETAQNPLSQVPGQSNVETANFFQEMYQYFQVSQGNLNALEELCKENPLPAAQQFLNVMQQLDQLISQGHSLVNQMNGIQDPLDQAKNKVNQDQQDLADCQAANSGSASSGGDGGDGAES
jgi:hypothetical protein